MKIAQKKSDLRFYWFLILFIYLYMLICKINTPEYILPVMCAFISIGIVLSFVKYSWMSSVSIMGLAHFVQYPFAAFIILTLSRSDLAIEPELWGGTPAGMWAMVLGMAGLSCGVLFSTFIKVRTKNIHRLTKTKTWITPAFFNLMLVFMIIPVVMFYISKGIYYHKNVAAYDVDAANTFGFVGYLVYISYAGCILQIRRYLKTKNKRDMLYALAGVIINFAAYAPSGARRQAMFILVASGLYFLQWSDNVKLKRIALVGGVILFITLLPLLEAYRSLGVVGATSFSERVHVLGKYLFSAKTSEVGASSEVFKFVLGRRLADYIAVGYLVNNVPDTFPYYGFNDVGEWFYYILPTLIRPPLTISYTYDADIMEKYSFRPIEITGGSSPLMLIGDLFNRAGWFAVFFGMFFIGIVLRKLDKWFLSDSYLSTMVWIMMLDSLMNLHAFNLLKIFTMLTRHILIYALIAIILKALLDIPKKKQMNALKCVI